MTDLMMPWSAPLNILMGLHASEAFVNTYHFVAAWLVDHDRTAGDAKLQAIIDLRDLLKKEPQRLTELHVPAVSFAARAGRLDSVLAIFMPQLDAVIAAVPKVPLDRFVTACVTETGAQLWTLMRCVDELAVHGVNATDDLQVMRESLFGVINRCCGRKLAVQLRFLIEHLNYGTQHLERLSERLKTAYTAKQQEPSNLRSISDEQAFDILNQLDGDHHA